MVNAKQNSLKRSLISLGGIIALGFIVFLVNALGDSFLSRASIDLTEDGLFSLSDGSRNIVHSIEEPITLKLYLSETDGARIPIIKMYGARVRDLLKSYVNTSRGKLSLEVYDPRPDSEDAEWAAKYGMSPIPIPGGTEIYFGLVAVNALGDEEVIPMFNLQRQEFLEYDITKALYSLSVADKPLVGILSSLPIKPKVEAPNPSNTNQPLPQPWIFASQLEKSARVVRIEESARSIPDKVSVLLVAHPKKLSEQTQYAIDQYIVKGGRAVFFVDPYAASDQPKNTDPRNPMASLAYDRTSSGVEKILNAWGVGLHGGDVVGDIYFAASVNGGNRKAPTVRFPVWLALNAEAINRDSIITSDLDNMVLPWAGYFSLSEVDGLSSEILFESSDQAMIYKAEDIRFSAQDPEALLKKYIAGVDKKILAVQVNGEFKSAFKKEPNPIDEAVIDENISLVSKHISQGSKPTSIVVISDVDFISDRFSAVAQNILGTRLISFINDNLIFASNTIDNLSGSENLISLRSRGTFTRPFTTVQKIESEAQDRYKQEEVLIQAKLGQANQRLQQLQSGANSQQGQAVFNQAMVEEIQKFRDERQSAQQKLREVRLKLREEKESLGARLMVLNTFFIPFILILFSMFTYFKKSQKKTYTPNDKK